MTSTASRPRAIARIAALAGAGVAALLLLTGCIKVDADVTISSDATGSGTLGFELQKEAATFLGITDLDSFKTQIKSDDLTGGGLSGFSTCEPSETDTGFLYSCSFTDQAFTDPTGIWTITKSGDSIVFHMVNAGQTGTEGSDAAALLGDASMGSVNVTATFPGTITEISGSGVEKTSDTTATITGTMTTPLDVTITSDTSGGGLKIAALLVVLAALAVVALIVVVIVVLLVRRRKQPIDAGDSVDADVAGMAGAGAAAVVLDDAGAPTQIVETVTETVEDTAAPVTETVEDTVTPVTETVTETVEETVTPVTETVTETVEDTVAPATETVTETVVETPPTPEEPGHPGS